MFTGTYTAIVTPFKNGQIDASALKRLIKIQVRAGVDGIVPGVETVKRLEEQCRNIIGVKEAGGNPDRVSLLRAALGRRFEIMSGDDSLTLPFMAVGAQGVISVASNVIPRQIATMVRAF